jgi:hypothetical protein
MNFLRLIAILLLFGSSLPSAMADDAEPVKVEAPAAAPAAPAAPAASGEEESPSGSGEYEIDYEEEPDAGGETGETESAEEAPAPKKSATKRASSGGNGNPAVQGTHSKNRFAPILKSDTKSIYKKNGKALDVDTD